VNLAHIRQSRPDSGLGFQVKVLKYWVGGTQVEGVESSESHLLSGRGAPAPQLAFVQLPLPALP